MRQVGQVTLANRGSLGTVCCAVNALENVIPLFFIFLRVQYNELYVAGDQPGSLGHSNSSE